jgi:hypothetical protein
MLHNGTAAATEFQKFIDHRGVVVYPRWGALARLGLACALQGDTAKAKTAYQDFFTLWRTPTPTSHPEAGQGRARAAAVVICETAAKLLR